jgi:hypothetical protein
MDKGEGLKAFRNASDFTADFSDGADKKAKVGRGF